MLVCARGIGGAGTGKTRMMMETIEQAMQRPEVGGDPFKIGFSSFTRAARAEAARRASVMTGVPQNDLERSGYYRTGHSVAYKQLGVQPGEIIAGNKEDDAWVSKALDSDVGTAFDDESGGIRVYTGDPIAAAALNYWNLSRSLVCPLKDVVEANQCYDSPGFPEILRRVQRYETAKRMDGRIDFTDLIARFVGVRFSPEHGPEEVDPDGDVPSDVVGWIFDEAQDASKLLDMACRRLVTGQSVIWAWLVGDPFQVLYSWAGASAKHFLSWQVAKEKTMPKSYRCAKPILELGESQLRKLRDGEYWDRGIAPADHDGVVEEHDFIEDVLGNLDPSIETLVVARLNRHVKTIEGILAESGVPFRKVKSKDGAYAKDLGLTGLWKLQHNEPVEAAEWTQILKIMPSRSLGGQEWFVRGSKKRWDTELSSKYDLIFPDEIGELGATEPLRAAIASGKWADLPNGGRFFARAAKAYGIQAVVEPKIRIGTVHSVKGQEADKVVVLSSVNRRTREAEEESTQRHNEERRIEYVAATRARKHLVIAHDPRSRLRMEFEL